MADQIKSTRGLALRGIVAKPRRHEAFVTGALNGESLTLIYASVSRQKVSPRKFERKTTTRYVQCERRWTPDGEDFWWQGVDQTVLSHTG